MKEKIGLCKNCLGCIRLEDINFKGVYRCQYTTSKQLTVEEYIEEQKNDEKKSKNRII